MQMNKNEFQEYLNLRKISCSDEQFLALLNLMESTLATNERFNLTAIKNENEFIEKMLLDSALALYDIDLTNKNVIDVGTGAGFPGMVLYILNPGANITLLDSTKKKIDYLHDYCSLNNYKVNCVSARAEDHAKANIEKYDYAFARAVAPLNILLELIVPMLKVGGTFVALKGPDYENEILSCKKAFEKLGCHLQKTYVDVLPNSKEDRSLIYIFKDKKTNPKYPREYKDIKDKPL